MVLFTEIHSLHEMAQCLDHHQITFCNMLTTLKKKVVMPEHELRDPDQALETELVI